MQLTNAPGKLVLPFAASGAKNDIPVDSQIGITAGAASLVDGFPPLTRTPLAAGGTPPSGLDMNGVLYELSAILRWANAGGGYAYDAAFATDSNVGGYPKGARIMRSDGLGYWFNTADNNVTDPEGAGAVAAGWVPDFTTGAAAVTMTSANVTLTAAQYGKPIIVITGLLTANLNLIFPNIVGEWIVINSTTGPYTITCKTAAGTGLVVNSVQALAGDATNIYSAVNDAISSMGELIASAGGTADALTATFSPAPRKWPNGVPFLVRAASANATTTPTFTANSGTLAAKTIVKGANAALVAGDIAGAGHWLLMQYDVTLDKVVLLNPATGIASISTSASIQGAFKNLRASATGLSANVSVTVDEIAVESAANAYQTLRNVSLTIAGTAVGANGIDIGTIAASTWYSLWVIWNGTTTAGLMSLSETAPTLPSGYTHKARVGWIKTDGSANKYPLSFKQYGRKVQFIVGTGNLTSLLQMASGNQGTPGATTTTWATIATGAFIPSTAAEIDIVMQYGTGSNGGAMAAPNASYQGYNNASLSAPMVLGWGATSLQSVMRGSFVLESTNIYYAALGATSALSGLGWTDTI